MTNYSSIRYILSGHTQKKPMTQWYLLSICGKCRPILSWLLFFSHAVALRIAIEIGFTRRIYDRVPVFCRSNCVLLLGY